MPILNFDILMFHFVVVLQNIPDSLRALLPLLPLIYVI